MSASESVVKLTGKTLTKEDVIDVARHNKRVVIDELALQEVKACFNHKTANVEKEEKVYGVTTGFGCFSNVFIGSKSTRELSRNLITSHSCALGDPLDSVIVRATMVIRANMLLLAKSGVDPRVVEVLVEMVNKNVTPIVPSMGSLGSSGDLCLLAHIALVFSKPVDESDVDDNEAYFGNERLPGSEAMARAGIERIELGPKEGLAVTNGPTVTTAMACFIVEDGWKLLGLSNSACSLSCEALMSAGEAFDERIHKARNQTGQQKVAKELRRLIEGSDFVTIGSGKQDAYSIRCYPQIVGCLYECLRNLEDKVNREINSVTDNPLIFGPSKSDILSGGNFHGQQLGFYLDGFKVALTTMANCSERIQSRLVDGTLNNGLPTMLTTCPGLCSGYMIGQYSSVSLVLECRQLSNPDSVNSLPTSANQEDHNANCTNSALHCVKIIRNCYYILAIGFIMAARGVEYRKTQDQDKNKQISPLNKIIYDYVRKYVPHIERDHKLSNEIESLYQALRTKTIFGQEPKLTACSTRFKLDTPRGTKDFGPREIKIRNEVIKRISSVFELHGGVPIDTPIFELTEVLMGKYGEEGGKLVFDLMDQGDQKLTLRYDLTVPFARYVAMNQITEMKRYHIGPVFRRDNPSEAQGRFRQFYQCDFDICGKSSPMLADAEILNIFIRTLQACNIQFFVKINDRRLLDSVLQSCGVPYDRVRAVTSSIDKLDKLEWKEVHDELIEKGVPSDVVNNLAGIVQLRGNLGEVISDLRNRYQSDHSLLATLEELKILNQRYYV
eukprot:NODE_256_length_3135_cov_49.266600_g221_i0.p1 GENE.NODE_256_length_3135_cov_49.266600_g221_i0~~NODE_256_length_3135_cov_49.266600_g221_i0.p1  ORF type:complete len:784 (-),score=93.55 NODE_256_length_3135_cov_49.266600_g221_i0:725-3076(-)